MDVLRHWRLKPIKPSHPCWENREAHAEIVVSGKNESEARTAALITTEGWRPVVPGMKTNLYSPWKDASATTCEEISTEQSSGEAG
jgi:hypothetical protein